MRVSDTEAQAIATYLGIDVALFRWRYLNASGDRLIDGSGPACIFLADGPATHCRIYPVRPEKCRTWPFWDELRENPDALRRPMRTCPGIEPIRGRDEDCSV